MLDISLPYKPVVMLRPDLSDLPGWTLPEGYTPVPWEPGMERGWCEIERACGGFSTIDAAMERFGWEFLPFPDLLRQRMWFALAPDGEPIATVTFWTGRHMGGSMSRIHWVATHPDHQRRGVARGLLAEVLRRGAALAEGSVYLTSQTWSWPAIRLYKEAGFLPVYDRPACWEGDWEPEVAWALIEEKLLGSAF